MTFSSLIRFGQSVLFSGFFRRYEPVAEQSVPKKRQHRQVFNAPFFAQILTGTSFSGGLLPSGMSLRSLRPRLGCVSYLPLGYLPDYPRYEGYSRTKQQQMRSRATGKKTIP